MNNLKMSAVAALSIGCIISAGAQLLPRTTANPLQLTGKASSVLPIVQQVPPRNAPARKAPGDIYSVPTTWAIASQAEFDEFTVIDADNNGDGFWCVWVFDDDELWPDGAARYYDLISGVANADDYLVTPGVTLEAGKRYYIDFNVVGGKQIPASGKHTFDVLCGTAPTVEGMTNTVLADIEVPRNATAQITDMAAFTAPTSGTYYFAFHLYSAPKQGNIYINKITVKEGQAPSVPGAVEDLQITPDANGALSTAISFTSPTKNINGEELSADGVDSVRIERETRGENDKRVITTLKVAKGEAVSLTDIDFETANFYTYTITPISIANGEGEPVSHTTYVGLDTPTAATGLTIIKTNDGVKLTWEASQAYHGGVFFPEQVTYKIYNALNQAQGSVTGSTEWSKEMNLYTGSQGYLYYYIVAENAAGTSDASDNSTALLAGKPYDIPLNETFANGTAQHMTEKIIVTDINGVTYGNQSELVETKLVADELSESGYAAQMAVYIDDDVYYGLGMIDLGTATAPRFTFQARNVDAKDTNSDIYVRVFRADDSHKDIKVAKVGDLATDKYTTFKVDLSEFAGEQFIKVGVIYSSNNNQQYLASYQHINVANFFVGELNPTDLALTLATPRNATTGSYANVTLVVTNNGDEPASDFTINMTASGENVWSLTKGQELASYASRTYDVAVPISAVEKAEQIEIVAQATISGEPTPDDNTASALIEIVKSQAATVSNLAASNNGETITLTWQAPPTVLDINEGFENYTPWAIDNFGKWTTADLDEGTGMNWVTGTLNNSNTVEISYPRYGMPFAWMITPNEYAEGVSLKGSVFEAYAGEQCAVSVYSVKNNNYADVDDWLISPELSGEAQEISFYINGLTFTGGGQQSYKVLYSTTDSETTSFTALGGVRVAPDSEWQKVTVALPEGSKYFAIENCTDADNAFVVMLDEMQFRVNNDEVMGYNIYRDGALVAHVQTDNFSEAAEVLAAGGTATYEVTVFYDDGIESAPVAVTVTAHIVGDVNGDGQVTIGDVSALYSIILGASNDFIDRGDVNNDGEITVGDVSTVYAIILGT